MDLETIKQIQERSRKNRKLTQEISNQDKEKNFLKENNSDDLLDLIENLDLKLQIENIQSSELDYEKYRELIGKFGHDVDREIRNQDDETVPVIKFQEKKLYESYLKYIKSERVLEKAKSLSFRLSHLINEYKTETQGDVPVYLSNTLSRFNKEIYDIHSELKEEKNSNPELFYVLNYRELRDFKRDLDRGDGQKGRIVETNSIKEEMIEVETAIRKGKPIFIHGELGSGKTEMAIRATYNYLNNRGEEKFADIIQGKITKFKKENPTASESEINREKNKIINEQYEIQVEKDLDVFTRNHPHATKEEIEKEKENLIQESKTAIIVSGSEETSVSDFTGHRVLNLKDIKKEMVLDSGKELEIDFKNWRADFKAENKREPDEHEIRIHSDILMQAYLSKSEGVVSEFYKGPIYRAMIHGRPIIIDEVNAIDPSVLIFLNHILTRKPGDPIPVQGNSGEITTVQKGFCVIMTGNMDQEDGENLYGGIKQMNAAFMSRLIKLEHDYLPQEDQELDLENLSKEQLESSELFHIVLAKTMNREGQLMISQEDKEKLWRLCCFAKRTQEIFSGHVGDGIQKKELGPNVMSMRQIFNILDAWTDIDAVDGKDDLYMRYQMDHYLFKNYINQTEPKSSKIFLFNLAKEFGFFQEGWDDLDNDPDNIQSVKFDIKSPKIESSDKELLDRLDVVELAYGKGPQRTDWGDLEEKDDESEIEDLEKIKKLQDLFKRFNDFENSFKNRESNENISPEQALEIMGEDLYIGPSDIEKTFNFTPEDIPNIPFSKERLDNARELGQQLILYVDSLDEKTPLTSKQMKSILPNETQKNNPLFYNNNWHETDSEISNITPRLGWRLTTPEIIPGSNDNKNYLEQTEHLITYLTDTVYKDSEIPEIYQTAIDEFNDKKGNLADLIDSDWKEAAKQLSELSINQLTRENYTEIIYRLALNEKKSGTQNLENTYSWSNNVDSGGELVRVGGFDSEGLHVLRWRPGHRGSVLGVCFSAGE